MMKAMAHYLLGALLLLVGIAGNAEAQIRPIPFLKEQSVFEQARFPRGGPAGLAVGKASIGLSFGDLFSAQAVTNLFSAAQVNLSGAATPAVLDNNNFPIANFVGGLITGTLGAYFPELPTTGPYLFAWDAGRSCFKINFLTAATITGATAGVTVANGAGAGNPSITGNCGQAGSVTVNWVSTSGISYQFDGAYTQWASNTTGKFYLARSSNTGWNGQSDAVAYATNGIFWAKEAVDFIKVLKPESIRLMGLNVQSSVSNNTNVVSWNYRKTLSAFTFFYDDYPTGTRCGSAASGSQTFCTISVSGGAVSAAAATDTSLAGWVDGEQITGNVASNPVAYTLTVSNVTSNGGNCQYTVPSTTGLVGGAAVNSVVTITGIVGATECNVSLREILSVDNGSQFTILQTKSNAWVSGGSVAGLSLPVSAVGSNGGNCQYTVASTSTLTASSTVLIEGITGATECNIQAAIASIDSATQFTIATAKTNPYTGSGFVSFQRFSVPGKSGGSKPLVNNLGAPIGIVGSSEVLAAGYATFTYNAVLDRVIYSAGGVNNGPPLEAQVQLANLVNANYWYNFPLYANDTLVTNTLNTVYSNLNANLSALFELDNELWNFQFRNTRMAIQLGGVLGITTPWANNGAEGGPFQALRSRQIFGNLLPASSWGASNPRVKRLYCFQMFPGVSNAVDPMAGVPLVSPGNAAYQAYVGGSAVNYDTSPNRPVDFIDEPCIAPYTGSGTAFSGQSADVGNPAPTIYDKPLLTNVINFWNGVGGTQADAINLIDQSVRGDIGNRVTTFTASGTTFTTPLAHNYSPFDILRFSVTGGTSYSNIDPVFAYQVLSAGSTTFTVGKIVNGATSAAINPGTPGTGTMTAAFMGDGNGGYNKFSIWTTMQGYYTKYQQMVTSGFSPMPAQTLRLRQYENALEGTAPSTSQCTALSINGTDCATLATAYLGWRNDTKARDTQNYFFQTFVGTATGVVTTGVMTNAKAPSNLVMQGGGIYGLNSNGSYTAPAQYQTFFGFSAFSTNWLLKRDLDPASNDNDPVWLEKAA